MARTSTAAVCLLLVLGAVAPVTAGASPSRIGTEAPTEAGADRPTIHYTVAVADRGENRTDFRVTAEFRGVNASGTERVWIPRALRNATEVRRTTGLVRRRAAEGPRRWDVATGAGTPSVTVRVRVPIRSGERRPRLPRGIFDHLVRFRGAAGADAETRVRIDGAGVAVGRWLYFGRATVHRVRADGQRVPVVVPAGIDARLSPAEVAAVMNRTGGLPGVPDAPDTLTVWYARDLGGAAGTGGYDTIELVPNATRGVVGHEYVHIAQIAGSRPETSWFFEASATYLAHLALVQHGGRSFDAFYDRISAGSPGDAHNLTDPDEVTRVSERVVAALDLRVRAATNGTATVGHVIGALNRRADAATLPDVYAAVRRVAGERTAEWLRRTIEEGTVPALPDRGAMKTRLAASRPTADFDGDGLANAGEVDRGTDPFAPDSEGDGLPDGDEVSNGSDPTAEDTDGDGLPDAEDEHPTRRTTGDRLAAIGWGVVFLGALCGYLTVGVAFLKGVDRLLGIVPARIASLSLARLALVALGVLLAGGALVASNGPLT